MIHSIRERCCTSGPGRLTKTNTIQAAATLVEIPQSYYAIAIATRVGQTCSKCMQSMNNYRHKH